ncbi:MAG TPA: lysylphosphatidylglycerol synthase transmembrane domain-containing protein [Stellaceae bacterium]
MTVEGDRSTIAAPRLTAMTPRSWVGFVIKLIVTVAILGLLARRADWHAVLQRASAAQRPLLVAAVAVIILAIFLAAARWRRLLRRNGIMATWSWAIRAAFTSLFIGQFLPGTVGADGAKLWLLWRAGHPLRSGAASIVADRFTALIGVLALILASLPDLLSLSAPDMVHAVLAAVVAIAVALGLVLCVPIRLPAVLRGGRLEAVFRMLDDVRNSIWSGAAAFAIALSVSIHLLAVTAVVLIATSLGVALDFRHAVGIVATAVLLAAVPLSVNGWGIREGAMVAGLSLVGIGQADAFLISVLFGLGMMLSTLPGAALWLFKGWTREA